MKQKDAKVLREIFRSIAAFLTLIPDSSIRKRKTSLLDGSPFKHKGL